MAQQGLSEKEIYENIKEYYGKILSKTSDLKACACTACSKPPKYILDAMKQVPNEILEKFYGCGNPLPTGIEGFNVLDLGSGSGRDCYVASKFVGEHGSVTGIDMTDEQLSVARAHIDAYTKTLGYKKPNLKFVSGFIEFLEKAGIAPNSMDLVISNCVVNLSPNKQQVLQSVFNVLKEGGEFHFSDIYCNRRIPDSIRRHKLLYGECIAGSLYVNDFISLCKRIGFEDPRVLEKKDVPIEDAEMREVLGEEVKFYSITYRLFKIKNLESKCEDYGQVAIYKGTLPEYKHSYLLDDHHKFETNKPVLVCGNTASMLGETWLKKHFTIIGDKSVHYGEFDCSGAKIVTKTAVQQGSAAQSSCCGDNSGNNNAQCCGGEEQECCGGDSGEEEQCGQASCCSSSGKGGCC